MTAHWTPVVVSPSSRWISGTAMETMVWSMNVIETAKIIAARIRFLGPPPPPGLLSATMVLTGTSSGLLVNLGGHSNAAGRPAA